MEEKLPDGIERLRGEALVKIESNTTTTGTSVSDTSWEFTVFRVADGTMKRVSTNGADKSRDEDSRGSMQIGCVVSVTIGWTVDLFAFEFTRTGKTRMTIGEDGTSTDGKKPNGKNEPGNSRRSRRVASRIVVTR